MMERSSMRSAGDRIDKSGAKSSAIVEFDTIVRLSLNLTISNDSEGSRLTVDPGRECNKTL